GGDFPAMMEMLVDSRPEVVTVDLPGEPQVLIADIGFDSPDPCGRIFDRWAELGVESGERYIENPHCLAPVVSVIIQDDHGMMYRVVLGEVPVNEGVTSLSVTLVGDLNGDPILPAYPLGVVAVEVRTPMPGDLAWDQEADITLSLYTS